MSDSEQDKKRNKLGYQRISIACAHCRRRKIRCLLADKDPQGRCQNCIRLKKECVFYPIDQQNAYDARSDHSGGRGVGSTSSSGPSSTSPDVQTSHGHGVTRSQFTPLSSNATHRFQGVPVEPSASFQAHYIPVDRPYQENLPPNSPWPPSYSRGYDPRAENRNITPGQSQGQGQHWAYEQSPGSGDFAPFPHDSAQQVRTPSTTFTATFPQSSPEQLWQSQQPSQLGRSMTYPLPPVTMVPNMPQYAFSFVPSVPQQLPPATYPPSDAPYTMRHMQGPPYSTPVPQGQVFSEHSGHPEYRDPQHQHGAIPVQQGYAMNWDQNSGALGFSLEEQHSIPSSAPPPYVVPSQRPR